MVPPEGLLSVEAARERLLALVEALPTEEVPVDEALGRALPLAVKAQRTLPPWNNSAMDGYALRASDAAAPEATLRVTQTIHAGAVSEQPLGAGECARIMTGAPLPPGADAVIMQERVQVSAPGTVRLLDAVLPGQHVRARGEEVEAGQVLLSAGTGLGLPEAGLLWAQGILRVAVPRPPRVALVSTGDELCAPEEAPAGRIVDTNLPLLAAATRRAGGVVCARERVRDSLAEVQAGLERAAASADLVLTSAGVSVGERDFVRPALEAMGASLDFWRVALRPGKPLVVAQRGKTLFVGLPGNPTSALVTFELFVRPALRRMLGHREVAPSRVSGRLEGNLAKAPGLAHYLRVRAEWRDGELWATPLSSQSSGTLGSAAGATHLLHFPSGITNLEWGTSVELIPVSWII